METLGAESFRSVLTATESRDRPAQGLNSLVRSLFTTFSNPSTPASCDITESDLSSNAAVHSLTRNKPARRDSSITTPTSNNTSKKRSSARRPSAQLAEQRRARRVSRRYASAPILELDEEPIGPPNTPDPSADPSSSSEQSTPTVYYITPDNEPPATPSPSVDDLSSAESGPSSRRVPRRFLPFTSEATTVPITPDIPEIIDLEADSDDDASETSEDTASENPFLDFPAPPDDDLIRPEPSRYFPYHHGWSKSALGMYAFAWNNRRKVWNQYAESLAIAQQLQDQITMSDEYERYGADSAYSATAIAPAERSPPPPLPSPPPPFSAGSRRQESPPSVSTSVAETGRQEAENTEPNPLVFPRMGSLLALRDEQLRETSIDVDRTFANFPLWQIRKILFVKDLDARVRPTVQEEHGEPFGELYAERKEVEAEQGAVEEEAEQGEDSFQSIDLGVGAESDTSTYSCDVDLCSDPVNSYIPASAKEQDIVISTCEAARTEAGDDSEDSSTSESEYDPDWRQRWNLFSTVIRDACNKLVDDDLDASVQYTASLNLPVLARRLEHPYVSYVFSEEPVPDHWDQYVEPDTSFVAEHIEDHSRPSTPALGRRSRFYLGNRRSGDSIMSEGTWASEDDEEEEDDDDSEEIDYGELVVGSRALFARQVKVEIIEVPIDDECEVISF